MSELFNADVYLKTVPNSCGVYRMYDKDHHVIYVGKAKNLKKRLSSYFRRHIKDVKTQTLVSHIADIDVTLTHSETDALLLENDLIKEFKPRYNVLLRDDKSYPYIFISQHRHPRLAYHRGPQREKGQYFGPYPNGGAVRESLHLMQKLFPVRQCSDIYYKSRSRPCLQYQIGRCSAPCVSKVSDEEYQEQVRLAGLFLTGKDRQVIKALVARMEQAATSLEYEQAGRYRDQIRALGNVSEQQQVTGNSGNIDVIGTHMDCGLLCCHLLFIRNGKILGNRSYFPKIPANTDIGEALRAFMLQFYLDKQGQDAIPSEIVVGTEFDDWQELSELMEQKLGKKVSLKTRVRSERANFLKLAQQNAIHGVNSRLKHKMTIEQRFLLLEDVLELNHKIHRMECFDISHTQGEHTVASCVVFDREGPKNQDYRKYNIAGVTPGDDYGAIKQAVSRRFDRISLIDDNSDKFPDLLVIDGGLGQLRIAQEVVTIACSGLKREPLVISIKKGEGRKAEFDQVIFGGSEQSVNVASDSPALHLIQHIRDESHRFAIAGHRNKRQKQRNTSVLEGINGIGPKRRKALLDYLGGWQGAKGASVSELAKVPGISVEMAQLIHDALRGLEN